MKYYIHTEKQQDQKYTAQQIITKWMYPYNCTQLKEWKIASNRKVLQCPLPGSMASYLPQINH